MAGLAARAAALTLLEKALARRGGLDEALSAGRAISSSRRSIAVSLGRS